MYKVIINSVADNQIYNHLEFLANKSLSASKKLNEYFKKSFKDISDNPFAFALFYRTLRKCVVQKRYVVLK